MTDYEGRRPRYEDFGERPPLTDDDIAFIAEALEDAGKPDAANEVIDMWYDAKQNREEMVRQFLNRLWQNNLN